MPFPGLVVASLKEMGKVHNLAAEVIIKCYVEQTELMWWKSTIVPTAGFSIDILIGDFQLSFCTKNTQMTQKVSGTFQKKC